MKKVVLILMLGWSCGAWAADDSPKPYSPPCVERDNVFEFAQKPAVKDLGNDKYEITFAVKGNCDATVGLIDERGVVVRHLGAGVLGSNAPAPFQKNSLKQTIYWNGKDDLDFYVKEPGKLRVRVMLGLKPEFDKRLGGTSAKNLPGYVWGIAADPDGVYLFIKGTGYGHITLRKFDHDANYVKTLFPPSADLPPEKLGGMGYVEYEPGKRAIQAPQIHRSMFRDGFLLPLGFDGSLALLGSRPAVAKQRIYLLSGGFDLEGGRKGYYPSRLHFLLTDGATVRDGIAGRVWMEGHNPTLWPRLAVSADGQTLYFVGFEGSWKIGEDARPVVLCGPTEGAEKCRPFVGDAGTAGSDDAHLNSPVDVACDGEGRVYIADGFNNRIQIFSPDRKFLKTIPADRPRLVQVHQKTGAVYVAHAGRLQGRSVGRISKFKAFPDLSMERGWDGIGPDVMTLDSWSAKPRIWLAQTRVSVVGIPLGEANENFEGTSVLIYEEDGDQLRQVMDFEEEAKKEAEGNFVGRWDGGMYNRIVCDPTRETLYSVLGPIFDLRTGKLLGWFSPKNHRGASFSEAQFDKRGYMHCHSAAHFDGRDGVVRLNPEQATWDKGNALYPEVPYDYGVERIARWNQAWKGVLPLYRTDHQLWTWGMGVSMRGDVAVVHHVEFAPKMDTEQETNAGYLAREAMGRWVGPNPHTIFLKTLQDQEKKGEEIYFVRRRPGIPLTGATIWTFESSGEIRQQGAVIAGTRNNGVQIDEDGLLYFTNSRYRLINGKPFLSGRGGNFGGEPLHPDNRLPFTGAYIKTRGHDVEFHVKTAPVPMDKSPDRPPDLIAPNVVGGGAPVQGTETWVEGAEWMFAGASPIVAYHCDCPQMRVYLDWYKRSFVPESYRHSIGVLDTGGNLILHVGQYGNFDSAYGYKSKVPVGGDGIGLTMPRFVSGTDNYLCFNDWGERLVVLKLAYYAEEAVPIQSRQP